MQQLWTRRGSSTDTDPADSAGPNEGLADAIRESLKIFEPEPEDDPAQGIEDGLEDVPMSAEEEALAEEIFARVENGNTDSTSAATSDEASALTVALGS